MPYFLLYLSVGPKKEYNGLRILATLEGWNIFVIIITVSTSLGSCASLVPDDDAGDIYETDRVA